MKNKQEKYVLFGAASTLAQSIILKLLSNGSKVCGVLHSDDKDLASGAEYIHNCDASNSLSVKESADKIEQCFGIPDHIINCVGKSSYHDFIKDDVDTWINEYNTNFLSAVNIAHYMSRLLVKNESVNKSIVMIGSGYSERHIPFLSPYCLSKYSIKGLVSVLSTELALNGIRINAVIPGLFPSKMTFPFIENKHYVDQLYKHIPDGKLGCANDIADLVIYLTEKSSLHINGSSIVIDGGMLNLIEGGITR